MLYTETKTNVISFHKEMLGVRIFPKREEMGKAAALDVSAKILELLERKEEINMIFAAAPSQNDFMSALVNDVTIPWNRINAFHMDEYIGLDKEAPQGFGNFLKSALFGNVPFRSVYYIDGTATDTESECHRYSTLLRSFPVDIVCLGIGENGHIAFNDPPVADFNDPKMVKVVNLEQTCRQQQVNDNCFTKIELVPVKAFTLTIPALIKGQYMFCTVPTQLKAEAVRKTLNDPVTEECPATILRTKKDALLYLDADSSSLLQIN
ncbi:MAG: glucosamine-6-phosphate deaminase [Proteiniphilum sp.]|nr:glucosamine-6-phosphate deaminase [Proteiniphilum sp.]